MVLAKRICSLFFLISACLESGDDPSQLLWDFAVNQIISPFVLLDELKDAKTLWHMETPL